MELAYAKEMALELMSRHGIGHWKFNFDGSKRIFGRCWYNQKRISLSTQLVSLNSESEVRNTILHEIAHALCPGQHHNEVWKKQARAIGCTGDTCYDINKVENGFRVAASCKCGVNKHKRHNFTKRKLICKKCRMPLSWERLRQNTTSETTESFLSAFGEAAK